MILYHYLELRYALAALQTGQWKIGRLNKLNDIFDCRPRLINHPRGMEGIDNKYMESFGETLGLVCYCAVDDDPTVWGHYGDQHRGIALGFVFNESERYFPHKVTYANDRPILDLSRIGIRLEDQDHDSAQRKLIEQGFVTKHPSWKYEQEFREFIPLNACQMQGEHYFTPIQWNKLAVIVLGANCPVSMNDVQRIIHQRDGVQFSKEDGNLYPVPEIRRCQPNKETYKLSFELLPKTPR